MSDSANVGQVAHKYHKGGYHCGEAVSKAILEKFGNGEYQNIPQAATAFGGGIGRTHDEICGALSGGFIALGCLYGRKKPDEDWDNVADLTAQLIKVFVDKYGATKCEAVLEKFGPQENMNKCKQLSGEVAKMLSVIIEASERQQAGLISA